jgi:hypothetical protein
VLTGGQPAPSRYGRRELHPADMNHFSDIRKDVAAGHLVKNSPRKFHMDSPPNNIAGANTLRMT